MLSGSLTIVSFAGLLQLLGAERRTGKLVVSPEDGASQPQGTLWLEEGSIVHAECGHGAVAGEPAALALVMAEEGQFRFEPTTAGEAEDPAPARSVEKSTEQLLLEAACRKDNSEREEGAELPGTAIPRFAPVVAGVGTPRFNTVQWRMLSVIDGKRSVAELATAVELPEEAVRKLVAQLVGAGVVELA